MFNFSVRSAASEVAGIGGEGLRTAAEKRGKRCGFMVAPVGMGRSRSPQEGAAPGVSGHEKMSCGA
jgi:hypothetical protein